MATLKSAGVQTSIIDESIYDSSAPGSVPLIVIATASNKVSPTGTGIAPYTANENASKLFVATSQRELVQNFGNPLFYTAGGHALHGHELNEYGLHAAYQFLGLASTAFILRADVDTTQLIPSDSPPAGAPASGTYWFDTHNTAFGVFQSNGKAVAGEAWTSQSVTPFYLGQTSVVGGLDTPAAYLGKNGDFGVVVHTNENHLFEKVSGAWIKVGSTAWRSAHPTEISGTVSNATVSASNSIVLNGSTVPFSGTTVTSVASSINNHADFLNGPISASVVNGALHIKDTNGGDLTIANGTGTPLATLGISAGTTKGNREFFTNAVAYPTGSAAGDVWVKGSSTNRGALWSVKVYNASTGTWQEVAVPFYAFSAGSGGNDNAAIAGFGSTLGAGVVYVGYDSAKGILQLRRYASNGFEALVYEASPVAPSASPEAGTMWYSTDFRADFMVSNGSNWIGYKNHYPNTNPRGAFISGSTPQLQSDGTPLVDYDLWIDATDLDNYPVIRRYEAATQRWKLIDTTDQTSPFGVLFGDARQDSGTDFTGNTGTYVYNSEDMADMLSSNFVDPDAPDPRTVPAGMLLFNTRYSTYNVKEWQPNYFGYGFFDANTDYSLIDYTIGDPNFGFSPLADRGRWVTISGNRPDGSPLMGRRAQRGVIVKAMSEAINSSEDARAEIVAFNLIAAPGYPELIDEMVTLNSDQGEVSFIVGDTPVRLKPDANSLSSWANNRFAAAGNGEEGLTTSNPYVGVYYPWGVSTNIDGADIMVPPSTMVLRTMAYNDQVSYPWFAPAGFTRGLITNATTVGYLDANEEFRAVMLSQGQRDTLYSNRINPIALIPNRGLVVYGQKTRAPTATALDRVNVARLVNYLRTSLDLLVKPFLFEQNDVQTRDSVRLTVDRFLSGLIGLRGIEDYAVQCNEDNNTGERVDRNELWVDVAIKPLKAIEFIYIPIRIENSGSVL